MTLGGGRSFMVFDSIKYRNKMIVKLSLCDCIIEMRVGMFPSGLHPPDQLRWWVLSVIDRYPFRISTSTLSYWRFAGLFSVLVKKYLTLGSPCVTYQIRSLVQLMKCRYVIFLSKCLSEYLVSLLSYLSVSVVTSLRAGRSGLNSWTEVMNAWSYTFTLPCVFVLLFSIQNQCKMLIFCFLNR
jgi:hypothetical protein